MQIALTGSGEKFLQFYCKKTAFSDCISYNERLSVTVIYRKCYIIRVKRIPLLKVKSTFLFVLVLFFSFFRVLPGSCDDFKFQPRFSATAEYNDNVEEKKDGRGDFVGILKPGLSASYEHSRVTVDLSYDYEYKDYLDDVKSDENNNFLDSNLNVEALKDLFYIDLSDSYQQVYKDPARDKVADGDTSAGTTEQNDFHFTPYFNFELQKRTRLKVGGDFQSLTYSSSDSVDKTIYTAYSNIDHELTDKWSINGGAKYERRMPDDKKSRLNRYILDLGTSYSYAEGSIVSFSVSPTYTDYDSKESKDTSYFPYDFMLTYAFTDTFVGSLSSEMKFHENPESGDTENKIKHALGLNKEYGRGNAKLEVSYNDLDNPDSSVRTSYLRVEFGGRHALTELIGLNYNFYSDFYDGAEKKIITFFLTKLSYSITEEISSGLQYRFKCTDDTGTDSDYTSNTIGLNFSWSL